MHSTIPIKTRLSPNAHNLWERVVSNFCFVENRLSIKLIALLSFALSLSIIIFDPIINRDGVHYLFTAETFLQSGFGAALKVYFWPFFSILIASIHQITSLSLHTCSQLIVTLCFFIICYAFVRIVEEMGGSRTAQIFALLIISFHPLMADYRSSSVRDPGMWGFMLLSLLELMRYSNNPSLRHQINWLVYITLAFLFRTEVFVIAALSPLSLVFIGKNAYLAGIKNALRFVSIPAAIISILLFSLLSISSEPVEHFKLIRDLDFYANNISNLSTYIINKSLILSKELLAHTAKEDSVYAVISVFFTIFILNVFRAITPVYLLILVIHLFSKTRIKIKQNFDVIIKTYISIPCGYLFLFTISRQFSLERYSFQIVVIALLYLPFIIESLWDSKENKLVLRSLIIIVFISYGLDTVINSDYKRSYINDAAKWVQTEVADDYRVISNHHHIAYFDGKMNHRAEDLYSGRKGGNRAWKPDIIYAYHAKKSDEDSLRDRIENSNATIVKEFRGKEKGIVLIFKLSGTSVNQKADIPSDE